jgi:hypothetical protein
MHCSLARLSAQLQALLSGEFSYLSYRARLTFMHLQGAIDARWLDAHIQSAIHRLQHHVWPVRQRLRLAIPDDNR